MYYAAAHPQAVGTLLLLDTSPASWALNFPYFRQTIAERQGEAGRRELAALLAPAGARTDPHVMTRYYQTFFRVFFRNPQPSEQLELGVDAQWLAKNAVTGDRLWASIGEYDIHESLSRIQAPTLIVHGTSSVIAMEGAEAIAARVPRSRLVAFKDVGHFPYIEAPLAFSTAVRTFVWPR
jgi:proline iminopeptidase